MGEGLSKKVCVPPMHAANPALAIEHATIETDIRNSRLVTICLAYLQLLLDIHLPRQK